MSSLLRKTAQSIIGIQTIKITALYKAVEAALEKINSDNFIEAWKVLSPHGVQDSLFVLEEYIPTKNIQDNYKAALKALKEKSPDKTKVLKILTDMKKDLENPVYEDLIHHAINAVIRKLSFELKHAPLYSAVDTALNLAKKRDWLAAHRTLANPNVTKSLEYLAKIYAKIPKVKELKDNFDLAIQEMALAAGEPRGAEVKKYITNVKNILDDRAFQTEINKEQTSIKR